MTGKTISHYQILDKLGQGGMGEVYLAQDLKLERQVALKFLPPTLRDNQLARQKFLREGKAAAALDHPFICQIFGMEEVEGQVFLVMEYLDGETLQRRLERGPLALEEALRVTLAITEALEIAHRKQIVHRDLKPSNIMLTGHGHVKVMDFGLAKRILLEDAHGSRDATLDRDLTATGAILGTLSYMSPEQARGLPVDARTDIFSLGVILYQMLAGVHPFLRETPADTLEAILSTPPPPLFRYREDLPEIVQHVVRKMLGKDPAQRYQMVREVRTDLSHFSQMTSNAGMMATAQGLYPPPEKRKSRRWMVFAGAAVAIAIAALFLQLFDFGGPSGPPPERPRKRLTFVGDAFQPEISPNGDFVAYTQGPEGGPQDLMVLDTAGGSPLPPLFESDDGILFLRWSPDGTRILFSLMSDRRAYIVPRFGGNPRIFPARIDIAAWSPDGSEIVAAQPGSARLSVFDLATGRESSSLELQGVRWVLGVDWAPNGIWWVVWAIDDSNRKIVRLISTDGQKQQTVLEDVGPIQSPRSSPQSDGILYLRDQGQVQQLWKLPVDPLKVAPRGPPVLMQEGLVEAGSHFSLSRDGHSLAYSRTNSSANLWSLRAPLSGVQAPPQRISTGKFYDLYPEFSPDGRRLAFSRGDGRTSNIFVTDLPDGKPRQITFFEAANFVPVWSPDGKEIAFVSDEGGKLGLWKVSLDGLRPSRFDGIEVSQNRQISWAPSRHILAQQPDGKNFQVIDPDTQMTRLLMPDDSPGWVFNASPFPQGERFLVLWNRSTQRGLWAVSGGAEAPQFIAPFWLEPIGWSSGGKIALVLDTGPPALVKRIRLHAPPQPETLLQLPSQFLRLGSDQLTVTADGTQFAFAASDVDSDLWLIENFGTIR